MNKMILFDLDGTLWDTLEATYYVVNRYLKDKGEFYRVDRSIIEENMGNEFSVCAKNYFPHLLKEESNDLLAKIYDRENEMLKEGLCLGKVYPNVRETLEVLSKNYILCLVSNCSNDFYIENFLNTANVGDFIKDYIAASKYSISKKEAIQKMIEKYSCKDVIYVGDTKKDQDSCEGCSFVHAKYGFGKGVDSKYFINSFEELVDLVPKIFKEV